MSSLKFLSKSECQEFDFIKINIASPEQIRTESFGEVKKPETINYRTFKPEKDGLFCSKIFGPVKDYECLCGKYKKMKYQGIVCEKCGVEVTQSKVRRERMGHIELATSVVHIWFLKSLPSRISILLDISLKDLERILYFEAFVIIDPGISNLQKGMLLTESDLIKVQDEYGKDAFSVLDGADGIRKLLEDLDLKQLKKDLHVELKNNTSEAKRKKIVKRLQLIEDFLGSNNNPEWMVLTVLPVIPPELRPMVRLDGGRFATSDLNDLYRRIINRNNRLKRLLELQAPDIVIRNEKRMLQESIDALFDNGRRGRVVKGANKRPLKSLSDMLKGKQGRFRQNLLGKRVDYSGRSVIVVGPELRLHECGIPKKMALELFKPFVFAKLERDGIATTIRAAKRMVETEKPEVWDALEHVIKEHPVLLNRAPTLHRLGIQAFEPILIEGKAIQLHPLVCTAFNADFDGDQMAVHLPLSIEAQMEARVLMMSTNNILNPANGKPIIIPDKDIILGLYYLTLMLNNEPGEGKVFDNMTEINSALYCKLISIHSKIKYRCKILDIDNVFKNAIIETTPGRLKLKELLPESPHIDFKLVNKLLNKKNISSIVEKIYHYCGPKATVLFVDSIMRLGFQYSFSSGMSFGMDDMIVPETKQKHIEVAKVEVMEFESQYAEGLITYGEKYNKIVDAWSRCTDNITNDLMHQIALGNVNADSNQKKMNAIFVMFDSGARGSPTQTKQICGMRGLIAKPSGAIIETPIISNFKEGLTILEYFNSTHGARKGLADTALKTANSGYLTRRLVDVAQDCIIKETDCGTQKGITINSVVDNELAISLSEQALGRVVVQNVYNPLTSEIILESGDMIDEENIAEIEVAGISSLIVRSVLTCESTEGVCSKCYGRDLSTGKLVSLGEAVGIIAAQSIGEPGTQLTLRTFHIGGAANRRIEISSIEANFSGIVRLLNSNIIYNSEGIQIIMSRSCEIALVDEYKQERVRHKVPYGAKIFVKENDYVNKGTKIAEWDPYTIPIISEKSGKIALRDVVEGVSVRDITDEATGISSKIITEAKHYSHTINLKPRIDIVDDEGNLVKLLNGTDVKYYLPVNAILALEDGVKINAGDLLARIPKESTKTKDITGGLPRVTELVEARKPKDPAIIVELDGKIEFGKDYKTKRKIILHPLDNSSPIEYIVPKGKHILVNEGDLIKKGDILVDGDLALQDILTIMGIEALANYILEEIQTVYRLQGVKINNKHIEIIVKQMLQKVEVTNSGDTTFIIGEKVNKQEFKEVNDSLVAQGLCPAKGHLILHGITKSSLQTRSFISAASFQETTKVLTDAAVRSSIDRLTGIKENVIVGRLIPAGTGLCVFNYRKIANIKDKEINKDLTVE